MQRDLFDLAAGIAPGGRQIDLEQTIEERNERMKNTVEINGRNYPAKWEICDQCEGEGKSSAYLGAYTGDQMAEAGPEFFEDYMAGAYDRQCETCGGTGKVLVADHKACTATQAEQLFYDAEAEAEYQAERRAENLYGY